jgi:hypothetical protein
VTRGAEQNPLFPDERRYARALIRSARVICELWEETTDCGKHPWESNAQAHSRILEWLVDDRYIVMNDGPGLQREHLVPLARLRQEGYKICERNLKALGGGAWMEQSIREFATLLAKHLRIVRLSREDRARIDKSYKADMPPNWTVNDGSLFARLEEAYGESVHELLAKFGVDVDVNEAGLNQRVVAWIEHELPPPRLGAKP